MKYTNKHNFPDFVQEWLEFDEYDHDENTLSATTLMKPARAYALAKQNQDKIEIDISDLIASRYGTAIHDSVEKVNLTNCKQEERLSVINRKMIITGKFDILRKIDKDQYELIDVKSTSVWTYIYGSKTEDYIKQLSIYRWLAIQNNYNVIDVAKIWMVFTDWNSSMSKKSTDYPNTRIAIKNIKLWGEEKTLKYIGERIKLFDNVVKMQEKDMPKCTDEELWASDETWAIMKDGRKSAVKLLETEQKAKDYIKEYNLENTTKKHTIVHRPGTVKRCKYCSVRKFCSQYKELVDQGRSEDYENDEKRD